MVLNIRVDRLGEHQVLPGHAGEFEDYGGVTVKLCFAAGNVGEADEGSFVEVAFIYGLDDVACFAGGCAFLFHDHLGASHERAG